MGMKGAILLDDATSSGGRIISASGFMIVDGKPVACVGNKATCHLEGHGGTVTIVEGSNSDIMMGRMIAYDGCALSCGCRAMATTTRYMLEPNRGGTGSLVRASGPMDSSRSHIVPAISNSGFSELKQKDNGDVLQGAWLVFNTWNEDWIQKYQAYAPIRANYYIMKGSEAVCDDFVLQVIIDFSYENHLPFNINNGTGRYQAKDTKWNLDKETFVQKVKHTTGASDIALDSNTSHVAHDFCMGDLSQLKAARTGNIFVFYHSDGTVQHVAMICELHDGYVRFAEGQQGIGSSDSSSILYGGKLVKHGTLNTNNGDILIDGMKPEEIRRARFQFKKVVIRRWNHMEWNP